MVESLKNPFYLIRGRKVLSIFFFVPIPIWIIVYELWPNNASKDLWMEIVGSILAFYSVGYLLASTAKRAELNLSLIIGRIPVKEEIVYYSLFAIPLSILSIGCVWLFYWPLSYFTPGLVKYLLIEDPTILIWSSGPLYGFANLINLFLIIVIVPILEEFVFRGLLISRWSTKWQTPRAILFSSIIFGVMHVEFIGGIFFGYVMSILYIRTKSLVIPVLVHGITNLIAWLICLIEEIFFKPMEEYTLNDFQSEWWIGMLCLIIGIPWGIRYLKTNWPEPAWRVPYFA